MYHILRVCAINGWFPLIFILPCTSPLLSGFWLGLASGRHWQEVRERGKKSQVYLPLFSVSSGISSRGHSFPWLQLPPDRPTLVLVPVGQLQPLGSLYSRIPRGICIPLQLQISGLPHLPFVALLALLMPS